MAKSKRYQDTPKPISAMQPPYSYSVNEEDTVNMTAIDLPPRDQTPRAPPSEDAGVCVVCEDECTCGTSAAAASASTRPTAAATSPPTIKRRLILKVSQPAPHSTVDATSGHVLGNTNLDASSRSIHSSSFSAPVPVPRHRPAHTTSKKRGRPTKAELDAREAAARAASSSRGMGLPSFARRGTGGLKKSRVSTSSSVHHSHFPSTSDEIPLSSLPTFVPASLFGSDSSDLSSPSSESDSSSSDSDSNSMDEDDPEDDDDDILDSDIEAEEEEHMIVQETLAMQKLRARREREREAQNQQNHNQQEGGKKWDKRHWTNRERERHASVGAEGQTLSESDESSSDDGDGDGEDESGSGGDDEQEDGEDDEGEDEDELVSGAGAKAGYASSDDEDGFDADIFFANLSDSSFDSSSSDSEPEHPSAAQVAARAQGGLSLAEAVEAGLVSEFELQQQDTAHPALPLVMTDSWDGGFMLTHEHELKDGAEEMEMIDVIFGVADSSEWDSAAESEDGYGFGEGEDGGETDVMNEDEDGMGMLMDEGEYEAEYDYDVGDTTDEDEVHPELGSILFADSPFNPLPPPPTKRSSKKGAAAAPSRLTPALSSSSGSGSTLSESGRLIPAMGSFTISVEVGMDSAVIDGSRSSVLPSPYPRPEPSVRKRRGVQQNSTPTRSPKRVRQSSERLLTPTPTPQTPGPAAAHQRSVTSPPESTEFGAESKSIGIEDDPIPPQHDTPRALDPPAPIDLDDVLHMLSDEDAQQSDDTANASASDATASTSAASNRWDRIPFNAFHRLRSAAYIHSGMLGSPVSTTVTMAQSSATSPRVGRGGGEFAVPHPPGGQPSSPYTERSSYSSWDVSSPASSPVVPRRSKTAMARDRDGSRKTSSTSSKGHRRRLSSAARMLISSPVLLPTKEEDGDESANTDLDSFSLGGFATPGRSPSVPASRRTSSATHPGHGRSRSLSITS